MHICFLSCSRHALIHQSTPSTSSCAIMPPKQSTSTTSRGRPPGSKNKTSTTARAGAAATTKSAASKGKGKERAEARDSSSPNRVTEDNDAEEVPEIMEIDSDDDEEPSKTIPPDLLTRILHEFFEKEGTRITKDANNAVAQYMDTFVKEAIARAAAERQGGFLEVSVEFTSNDQQHCAEDKTC